MYIYAYQQSSTTWISANAEGDIPEGRSSAASTQLSIPGTDDSFLLCFGGWNKVNFYMDTSRILHITMKSHNRFDGSLSQLSQSPGKTNYFENV